MKKIDLIFICTLLLCSCKGQNSTTQKISWSEMRKRNQINNDSNAVWDIYIAQYEEGPGSTVLNMDLIKKGPHKDFPFVLNTGVTFVDCSADGFPNQSEFENLYTISDTVNAVLSRSVEMIYAGTFTCNCRRDDYFYLKDTLNVRSTLDNIYNSQFKKYQSHIRIKEDKDWKTYLDFLYPNEISQEYMYNEKVILNLVNEGDNLQNPRQVDHWIYFSNEDGRNNFIKAIKGKGFKIENKDISNSADLKYKLQISRIDKVDLNSITNVTLELRKLAEDNDGDYDGWETFVIK